MNNDYLSNKLDCIIQRQDVRHRWYMAMLAFIIVLLSLILVVVVLGIHFEDGTLSVFHDVGLSWCVVPQMGCAP